MIASLSRENPANGGAVSITSRPSTKDPLLGQATRGLPCEAGPAPRARVLNWCEDVGLMDRAPIPKKLLLRIQERPPDRLTDEEVARLMVLPEPYGLICRLALGTGMRWGELVRATAADVQGGMLVVHQTKSGKIRRVPLSRALRDELRMRVGLLLSIKDGSGLARQVRRLTGIERFILTGCVTRSRAAGSRAKARSPHCRRSSAILPSSRRSGMRGSVSSTCGRKPSGWRDDWHPKWHPSCNLTVANCRPSC